MEVDSDLEANFVQQFSCLGTTDKEVLISEFQRVLDNQLNPQGCAFFLDMNNWNLQAAICSYYDYDQPKDKLPNMSLVRDITIGEGESVPPNIKFIKTWRIQNTGDEQWPPLCALKFLSGDQLGNRERVIVEPLRPGEMTDVSIEMYSPSAVGTYQGKWRMTTPTGMYFGDVIWVILAVDEGGLLGVTQQLSQFEGVGCASPHKLETVQNPFASPNKLSNNVESPLDSNTCCGDHQGFCTAHTNSDSPERRVLFQTGTDSTMSLSEIEMNNRLEANNEDADMS